MTQLEEAELKLINARFRLTHASSGADRFFEQCRIERHQRRLVFLRKSPTQQLCIVAQQLEETPDADNRSNR